MATTQDTTVANDAAASKLPDGVRGLDDIAPQETPGCTVFVHYNGPTDQLRDVSMGMAVLAPGASPHEPHQHPEEEFLLIASGTGEILCGDTTTQVGPGSVMYCAGHTLHGVTNTGPVPMTFYWSKWMARSA
jgi:mannose-6-phosphate isomerase-like protein (cupin superfamily)